MHLEGLEENVILLDSVSKRYSMCGVRIGAIVSKNKAVMGAVLRYAQARLCSPALGQVAAEGALKTPQSYFDAVRKEYMTRRDEVRIAYVLKTEDLKNAMRCLEEALKQYPGRTI